MTKIDVIIEGSMPPTSVSSPIEDPALQSLAGREGEKKKDKRVMKVHWKTCPGGSNGHDDSPREDPSSDLDLV
ncbi:hypothetical protein COCNU_01G016050 [Cocos nucifera]|uniref:Uncharacterized protein n=1 Tax=Cocos nucifera TaxID=13894 RepID=A0A8K0MV40_COCNU|nr:hypothetical protein COCNU_01G016050 [Cocos nucifera]